MLFTHILVGMLYGTALALLGPVPAVAAVLAGGIGGLLPDIDMVAVHRRTLHAPVLHVLGAAVCGALVAVRPDPATGTLAAMMGGMALHSASDVLGGGKELRPWERTDDRAVYCHMTGSWWRARRLLYDGSPMDLVVAMVAGGAVLVAGPAGTRPLAAGMLLAGTVYVVLRRPIAAAIPGRYARFDTLVHELLGLPDREVSR